MRNAITLLALATASLAPSIAVAQDSVSKLNGVPGDAIDPHNAAEQINDYVVDLASFRSSWDKVFAVAPIAKASQQRSNAPLFFTGQFGAQAISRRVVAVPSFLRGSYSLWTMPGFGVNDIAARNDPGTPVSSTGLTGFQFGFGFSEFSDGDPTGTNVREITGGIVNLTAASPSRLYVSRITAATNGDNDGCSLDAFGMGAVDDSGNIDFRADGNTTTAAGCPAYTAVTGNNLIRVDMSLRGPALNVLSGAWPLNGDVAATTWVLNPATPGAPLPNSVTHNTPNLVPKSLAGRPILIGSRFGSPSTAAGQYVYESAPGTYATDPAGAHLAGLADHRGAVGYSTRNFPGVLPGSVNGTAAIVSGTTFGSSALRDSVAVWGLDASGQFVSPLARTMPAPAAGLDPDQPAWAPTASQEFDHYHSQTAFQGGSAQIAVGGDQAGNLLVAGVVYYGFTPPAQSTTPFTNPRNYIAVARIDPASGATTWRAAAWTDAAGGGKDIYQNGTTVIGHLRAFFNTTTLVYTGPTMCAPMIDSVGNVWFVGPYELASAPGNANVGLFRSVWNPATQAYRLELVLAQGQVVGGRNSGRNYLISFFNLNDSDSIASGAAWSGNIAESAHLGMSAANLATDDPRTLGGIVIPATIIYDNNGDGMYIRSTGTGGVPGSPDEDYNVLLYVGASQDCNSNGIPDDREIADSLVPDLNGNGIPDPCDSGAVVVSFCTGSSPGTTCLGCGNNGALGHGCGNTAFPGGALLTASGNASIGTDTLVLTCSDMTGPGLFFQSNATTLIQFGDGMLCAAVGIIRMGVVFPTGAVASYPGGLTPNPIHIAGAPIAAGNVKHYQCWYRDIPPFCTAATYNLSQGLSLAWAP